MNRKTQMFPNTSSDTEQNVKEVVKIMFRYCTAAVECVRGDALCLWCGGILGK